MTLTNGRMIIGGLPNYGDGVYDDRGLQLQAGFPPTPDAALVRATSEVSTLPASFIADQTVQKKWRSKSRWTGDIGLRFGFSDQRNDVAFAALHSHNLSPEALWRVFGYINNNPAVTPGFLDLNGTTGYISVATPASLGTAGLTLEAWVRPDSYPASQMIVARGATSGAHFQMYIVGGFGVRGNLFVKLRGSGDASSTIYSTDDSELLRIAQSTTGGLVHVAFTYDPTTDVYAFYLQGRLVKTATGFNHSGNFDGTGSLYIGRNPNASDMFLDGAISDVRTWSVVRTEAQIRAWMHTRANPSTGGLVGCWRIDEGAGTTITDYGTGLKNGVLNGTGTWTTSSTYLKMSIGETPSYDSGWLSVWPGGPDSWVPGGTVGHIFSTPTLLRHVWIDIWDNNGYIAGISGSGYNLPDYVEVGRGVIGPHFSPGINVAYGVELGYNDLSLTTKSRGGQTWSETRNKFRTLMVAFENLQIAEAIAGVLQKLQRDKGVTGHMVVTLFPDDATYAQPTTLYCRLRTLEPVIHNFFGNWAASLQFEELI